MGVSDGAQVDDGSLTVGEGQVRWVGVVVVVGRLTCELEDLCSEVFEDG